MKYIIYLFLLTFVLNSCKKNEEKPNEIQPINSNSNTNNNNNTNTQLHNFEYKFYCKSGYYQRNYSFPDSISHPNTVLLSVKNDTSIIKKSTVNYKYIEGEPYKYAHVLYCRSLSNIPNDTITLEVWIDGKLRSDTIGIEFLNTIT